MKERDFQAYCPCGGIILADTEDWETPLCNACYEVIGKPAKARKNAEVIEKLLNSQFAWAVPIIHEEHNKRFLELQMLGFNTESEAAFTERVLRRIKQEEAKMTKKRQTKKNAKKKTVKKK